MEKILRRVYSSEKTTKSLKIISHVSSFAVVIAFAAMLAVSCFDSISSAVKILTFAAVPYVIVTLARRLINAKRPYETYGFYEVKPKDKNGLSFPSRHVFSAFVIATLALLISVWLAIPLFLIGLCIAVSRVLTGTHFVRDVIAGALVGILAGVIGILVF